VKLVKSLFLKKKRKPSELFSKKYLKANIWTGERRGRERERDGCR